MDRYFVEVTEGRLGKTLSRMENITHEEMLFEVHRKRDFMFHRRNTTYTWFLNYGKMTQS